MDFSKLNNKKVGIIGIGYIGLNMVNYLKDLNLNIDLILITRDNFESIKTIEFDYLINSAGNSGNCRDNIIGTIDSNIKINSYIIQYAKIKYSYIYLSSSRIYGFSNNKNELFDENYQHCSNNLNIDFIYDGSKKLTESLLINSANNVDYNIAILRITNIYGKLNLLNDSTLIKKIIRYSKEGRNDLRATLNRYSTKDYVHIDDAIECIIIIMLNLKHTDVYNVAYGTSYSIDDISNILNMNIESDDSVQPIYSNVSNKKIKQEFNITFKYSLEDGLK
jgi:nucleoside-diphosphate-sugar epimerase